MKFSGLGRSTSADSSSPSPLAEVLAAAAADNDAAVELKEEQQQGEEEVDRTPLRRRVKSLPLDGCNPLSRLAAEAAAEDKKRKRGEKKSRADTQEKSLCLWRQ